MKSEVRAIRTPVFDFDYWLCRCEGFRVDSPAGRVGVVVGAQFRSRHDRPDVLAVRSGPFRRLLLVPVEEVAELAPREERIVLVHAPQKEKDDPLRLFRHRLAGAANSGRARATFAVFAAAPGRVRGPLRLLWRSIRRSHGIKRWRLPVARVRSESDHRMPSRR